MKAKLIMYAVQALMSVLTEEMLEKFADMVLDYAEKYVLGTASKIDDKVILPICDLIRSTFGIEDND